MDIPFSKMHGLGNCYIYIDTLSHSMDWPDFPELSRRVSDSHTGMGSDGLIVIGQPEHPEADIQMRIFNKDGSEAKNCGNGLRCVAKYAYERHLLDQRTFVIETLGGLVEASVHVDDNRSVGQVTINMGQPQLERRDIPMSGDNVPQVIGEAFVLNQQVWPLTAVSMGNPHAIFFVDDIQKAPVESMGRLLADGHERFPEGVNVGFVEKNADHELNYVVWERGSGRTQACGTGACAATVAAVLNKHVSRGQPVTVHLEGGDLSIEWDENKDVLMTGAAEWICDGRFHY